MNDRCVIDYHQLELLKQALEAHFQVKLERAFVNEVFKNSSVIADLREYQVVDSYIFEETLTLLASRMGSTPQELTAQLILEFQEDMLL